MAIRIDGKETAALVRREVAAQVQCFREKNGRTPCLAVILVGEDPASQVYVRNKEKACAEVGIESRAYRLPAQTRTA